MLFPLSINVGEYTNYTKTMMQTNYGHYNTNTFVFYETVFYRVVSELLCLVGAIF